MFDLRIPVSTYRLQFNSRFRFKDASNLVSYLCRLGISDLYASPILKARRGSSHGYDVTDPTRLNTELGTETDFYGLVQELHTHDMGLLLDIVPNHMAACPENSWWTDVLENGLYSPYASLFDIGWNALNNRILLPVLNRPYNEVLDNQELELALEDTGLFIRYHDYSLPLDIKSYHLVLSYCLDTLKKMPDSNQLDYEGLRKLEEAVEYLPSIVTSDPRIGINQYQERQAFKEFFMQIIKTSPGIKELLLRSITLFNEQEDKPKSLNLMHNLLEQQVYQLKYWKTSGELLNYRRFFDINDLIGISVEEPKVLEATHSLIFKLIREGKVSGLRIDHIDGLKDPLQYLLRLQQQFETYVDEKGKTPRLYVIVEKVLALDEAIPPEWPIFGTTGYDFLNTVNALFVDKEGARILDDIYTDFIGRKVTFNDTAYEKKKRIIQELFPGEFGALGVHLSSLIYQYEASLNLSLQEITRSLIEVTVCLPVYRTYTRTTEVSHKDKLYLDNAIGEARRRNSDINNQCLDFIGRVLAMELPNNLTTEQKDEWLNFVLRWQQMTGAVMAKGFEDTALYTYNRLISLNDVGGEPLTAGLSISEFHHRIQLRLTQQPHTLNTTSTHDTKRSEDVRARINVLSEIPQEWEEHLIRWGRWNQSKKQIVNGLSVPEPNMEILLYQTLIGSWPLYDREVPEFKQRLTAYIVKAAREAKAFTNWLSPDIEYEVALIKYLDSVLDISLNNDFLDDFLQFQKHIAYYGALNSLAQLLLKVTSPGVPDLYQGTELWDFSLVDPDNRRPVDFKTRSKMLDDLIIKESEGQEALIGQLMNSWEDGRIKIYLTYKALNVRKSHSDLFLDGEYIPMQVYGEKQEHLCAFARKKKKQYAVVVAPRLFSSLFPVGTPPVGQGVWGEDLLLLPDDMPEQWYNTFTGEKLRVSASVNSLKLAQIFGKFPVALLTDL